MMKRLPMRIMSFAAVLAFLLAGCDSNITQQDNAPPPISQVPDAAVKTQAAADSNLIPGQYIVAFKDQAGGTINNQAARQAVLQTQAVLADYTIAKDSLLFKYKYALKGFAAKLSPKKVDRLRKDPRIKRVTQARMFRLATSRTALNIHPFAHNSDFSVSSSQTTPWGVTRVGGPLDGTGKKAWIIDSGIDLDHPDLNVDVGNSASFVAYENADDQNGHGTHVAGIIAAVDNNQDVVGVAAGATVVSIKVCNSSGFCPEPGLINGIDFVGNHAASGDVANISIGGPTDPNLDDAITTAANNGLRITIAAGNNSDDANNYSPARVENANAYTVSAFKQGDIFVSFSNYGNPPIEYSEPGVDVLSLWKNGGTNTISGTSMAAPHLAGLLLASPNGVNSDGVVSSDPDGDPDPIGVADIYLSVSMSGPNSLAVGEHATYTASVSGGDGNYSYEWYYRSDDTNNQWDGPVSYTNSYSTQLYSFDGYQLDIRVAITDGSGRSGGALKTVTCSDCDPGGGGGPLSPDSVSNR